MFGQATMLFVFLFIIATAIVDSYTVRWPVVQRRTTSSTVLDMGKGFNNARSRQAELAKKMELAKMKQTESLSGTDEQPPVEEKIDGRDVDEDHKMFQRLLDTTKGALPTDTDTDSAFIAPIKAGQQKITQRIKKPSEPTAKQLAKQLEKAEIKDKEKRRIAQRIHFESLIDVQTSRQLGAIVAAQLVPWVPPYLNDCLIVFADPRTNSMDLRQAIKYLSSACSNLEDGNPQQQKIMDQVVVITADSDQEIQS
jgi:Golgi nucleoside diphosphatase